MSNQNDQIQNTLGNIPNIIDLLGKSIVEHTFKKFEEIIINKPYSQIEGAESINNVINNSTFYQNKLKNYKLISDNLKREHSTSFNNKSEKFKIKYKIKEKNIMDEKTYKETKKQKKRNFPDSIR